MRIKTAAAILLLLSTAVLAAGCSSETRSETPTEPPVSATVTESVYHNEFDPSVLAENSRTSVLLEKYGSFTVKTVMDYGEKTEINSAFSGTADSYSYINTTDDSVEYFDGKNDYLLEESPDGESAMGSAFLALPGAETIMDLENYIFKYSEEDGFTVTDVTEEEDGSYTVYASENFSESYDDAEGETVYISYKFEYEIRTTPDMELLSMKCTCIDANTGETDHTLEISADYGAAMPELPDYMNETFEITVIVISGGNEVTAKFEVPEMFQPVFYEPADGSYTFCYDREGTNIIEDTMMIDYPCMIYAIKDENLISEEG